MTPKEREEKILESYPLVRSIATRMVRRFPSHIEVDDLINIGTLGLIEALDRYDPSRGVPFRAYAEMRIRGAIVDALRQADWVPRSVRRRAFRLDDARITLKKRLGRDPTLPELAEALEISVDELRNMQKNAQIHQLDSLDKPLSQDGDATLADTVSSEDIDVDDRWILAETTESVHQAMLRLPEREQQVVMMYYLNGQQLAEIGQVLGVSESRVCQLRGQAVRRLQSWLASPS